MSIQLLIKFDDSMTKQNIPKIFLRFLKNILEKSKIIDDNFNVSTNNIISVKAAKGTTINK
jgi:hypothetical protein